MMVELLPLEPPDDVVELEMRDTRDDSAALFVPDRLTRRSPSRIRDENILATRFLNPINESRAAFFPTVVFCRM